MTWSLFPAYAYLAALTLILTIINIRTRTLPNVLTLSGYPIMAILLVLPAALDDRWTDLGRALLGSALTLLVFVGLGLMSPTGWGMGDAKLAGVLAMPLAFASWMNLLLAMAGAFIFSALASIVFLLLHRVDRRSLIPFGPFLMGRRERARDRAQKVPVKILLPVIACFLPGIFIIVLGPAAISFVELMGSFGN